MATSRRSWWTRWLDGDGRGIAKASAEQTPSGLWTREWDAPRKWMEKSRDADESRKKDPSAAVLREGGIKRD